MFACSFDENGLLLVYPCEEAEEVLADLIQQEITLSGRIWGCISPERTACEERLFSDSQRSGAQLFSRRLGCGTRARWDPRLRSCETWQC